MAVQAAIGRQEVTFRQVIEYLQLWNTLQQTWLAAEHALTAQRPKKSRR